MPRGLATGMFRVDEKLLWQRWLSKHSELPPTKTWRLHIPKRHVTLNSYPLYLISNQQTMNIDQYWSIQRDAEHFESIDIYMFFLSIQKHPSMLFPSLRLFPIFPVRQAVVREAQANFVVTSWRVDVPMVPWPDRVRWEDVKQMSTQICPWK